MILDTLESKILTSTEDLPAWALDLARTQRLVGWDIETSSLDWRTGKIGTCQVFIPTAQVFVVEFGSSNSNRPYLEALLNDETVGKVFHHAVFDLRFMAYHWGALPKNVLCTKIASKILNPSQRDHSLKAALLKYLGIHIEKELGSSDWLKKPLTMEQVNYAVQDVLYLPSLLIELQHLLESAGKWHLAQESFRYLPTRATLDLLEVGDVFQYE